MVNIEGVLLTPLKMIDNPKGNIMHALKKSDQSFIGFGEAYFSEVNPGVVKGWKKHLKMTLNVIVPVGDIQFVLYDDRTGSNTYGNFCNIILGINNYQRLTVPPGIWMAFKGFGNTFNMLLNIASIEHDPNESVSCDLEQIVYNWN